MAYCICAFRIAIAPHMGDFTCGYCGNEIFSREQQEKYKDKEEARQE